MLNTGVNKGSVTWKEFCIIVATRMHVPRQEVEENFHALQLNEQVVLYAHELRERCCLIGLLSNASSEYMRLILRGSGLETVLDTISISSEISTLKLSTDAFKNKIEILRIKPCEAVMIDDQIRNIKWAQKAGLFDVHYRTFEQTKVELESLLSKS